MRNSLVLFVLAAAGHFFVGGPTLSWLVGGAPFGLDFSPQRLLQSVACGIIFTFVMLVTEKKR